MAAKVLAAQIWKKEEELGNLMLHVNLAKLNYWRKSKENQREIFKMGYFDN